MTKPTLDNNPTERLDSILFFQSSPGSANILADWQVSQAKQAITRLIEQLELRSRIDELEKYHDRCAEHPDAWVYHHRERKAEIQAELGQLEEAHE